MRSRLAIDVEAPNHALFELCRDVRQWPHILPHYRKVTVSSHDGVTVARMIAVRRFGPLSLPVAWRSRAWSDDSNPKDLLLRFVHVSGATRGMDVTWHITSRANGMARAEIVHDFNRPLPVVGADLYPRLIDRLFVKPIASQTLRTFKRLAEARVAPA